MLLGAIISMFVATIILAVGVCFARKNKTLLFLLQTFSLIALLCLGFVSANYKDDFSGYSIFILISIAPQFLSIFDFKEYLNSKKTKQLEMTSTEIDNKLPVKKEKKHTLTNSNGILLQSIALLLSAICIGFCGLYLGLETFYGFLIGLALAFALTFLLLIIKKNINLFDLLGYFFVFLGIGILIGQIVTVLLYSFAITNILFCIGALIYCVYSCLTLFAKTKFDHLVYFLSMFCLLSTLIF